MERVNTQQIRLYFVIALILLLTISSTNAFSCSMFKLSMYGKTMLGNNEDYWKPNTRIWFAPSKEGNFGAVYIGQDDMIPQGGINEVGLAFDLLSTEYKEVKNFAGKKEFPMDFEKHILGTCTTVEEVKSILIQYDLRLFETAIWVFADSNGKYLVVEGDSLIIGDDSYYIQSNFYPSCTQNLDDVNIPFYQKGRKFLNSQQPDTSLSFCSSIMDSMHQEWGFGGTLYTTIYDLNEGIIYLYFYHDYDTYVKFDITNELKKGKRILSIPDLFPDNIEGQKFLKEYNATVSTINSIDNSYLAYNSNRFTQLIRDLYVEEIDFRLEELLSSIAYKWLYNRDNIEYALQVFKLNADKFPNSTKAISVYEEVLLLSKDNYKRTIKIHPWLKEFYSE